MRTILARWSLALAVLVGLLPGCAGIEKHSGPCSERPGCPEVPAASRNRVYVFLVSGIDPLCGVEKLRDALIELGFIKVYTGTMLHAHHFAGEIERIAQVDPEARFAVVSQGSACSAARTIAARTSRPLDLAVLLDRTGSGPVRAERVVFVEGGGGCEDGHVAHATFTLTDAGLLGAAFHSQTPLVLAQELCALASAIPVVERGPPCEFGKCAPAGGGWDFLRPDGRDSGCINCKPIQLAPGAMPATTLPASPEEKSAAPPRVLPQPTPVAPRPKTSNKIPQLPPPPISPRGRGE